MVSITLHWIIRIGWIPMPIRHPTTITPLLLQPEATDKGACKCIFLQKSCCAGLVTAGFEADRLTVHLPPSLQCPFSVSIKRTRHPLRFPAVLSHLIGPASSVTAPTVSFVGSALSSQISALSKKHHAKKHHTKKSAKHSHPKKLAHAAGHKKAHKCAKSAIKKAAARAAKSELKKHHKKEAVHVTCKGAKCTWKSKSCSGKATVKASKHGKCGGHAKSTKCKAKHGKSKKHGKNHGKHHGSTNMKGCDKVSTFVKIVV